MNSANSLISRTSLSFRWTNRDAAKAALTHGKKIPPSSCVLWILILMALTSRMAIGQEAFCLSCQSARWKSIEDQMLLRAENLVKAQRMMSLAAKQADPSLQKSASALLAKSTAEWQEILLNSQTLGGNTYREYLARNLVDAEANYNAARAALTSKTAMFNRLRGALADQRQRILNDMEGSAKQYNVEHFKLGSDIFFEGIHIAIANNEALIAALRKASSPRLDLIDKLEFGVNKLKKVENARTGYQFGKGEYYNLSVDAGRAVVEAAAVGTALAPYAMGVPALTLLALDAASVGMSYQQWHEANQRLEDVRGVEIKWQVDLSASKATLHDAELGKQMAADAIERQNHLNAQLANIKAELGP
jgi:hypothetical protein